MSAACPICHGTGFALASREGIVSAVRCSCEQEQRGTQLLRAARIPCRYEKCTLELASAERSEPGNFEVHHASHQRAFAAARRWVDLWPLVDEADDKRGILFHGPPGTGKTHLAVGIARELILGKGARVLFYEQRELLKALQDRFDTGSPAEVFGPVLEAEILILDDVGAGRTTAWGRDVMHEIISHRYNERKPLILTSNHLLADETGDRGAERRSRARVDLEGPLTLTDRLGNALMSRLYEMCETVELQGEDYRINILHAKHRF